jgi:hypothetical protein
MSVLIPYSYGNFPIYRFYVAYVPFPYASALEVFPLNFLETSLIDELEGEEVFYRREFNGTLLFGTNSLTIDVYGVTVNRKDDYTFFLDIEQNNPCAKIYFHITKTVEGVTATYWDGYFSTTDGKWDHDKCTFEVTPLANDSYVDILKEADIQYNILDTQPPNISVHAVLINILDHTYTHNRWLLDVIEFLAEKIYDPTGSIGPAAVISATFFTANTNYVTQSVNNLKYLTIAQKSDIIRPASSNPATTAMMSWNEMMDILWAMFQVKWNYDGAGTFNVEHISWSGFASVPGLDLRLQPACVATNKYVYQKDKMPKFEKFFFMEADDLNFVGLPIWYDSVCVDQDPKTNVKEYIIPVTTDLEYIHSNPDAINDEGFVILANDSTNHVKVNMGVYDHSVKLNMCLSWANLHNAYFRHNRVLKTGYMNGILTTFWTAIKTKLQECSAIICDVFDSAKEITTELGETYFGGENGTVQRAELRLSGEIKFNLLYGPAHTDSTPIVDLKYALVTQTGALLTVILSEAADVNFTLTVLEYTDCTTSTPSPQPWAIHIGDLTDTYDISGHVIAGLTSSDTNWPVYFIADPTYTCA